MMGTRDPNDKEVREWLAQTPGASAGSFADAAQFAEVIVLVVLGRIVDKLIDLAWLAAFAGRWIRGARFRRCSAGVPTRALPRDSISSPGRDPEGAGGDTRAAAPVSRSIRNDLATWSQAALSELTHRAASLPVPRAENAARSAVSPIRALHYQVRGRCAPWEVGWVTRYPGLFVNHLVAPDMGFHIMIVVNVENAVGPNLLRPAIESFL